ncbi:hypothetical protein FRC07_008861 [Ceratobasidium sp. 392]|nr:hypothetical protein FRC07_008861 [Ceratobasidium sp. 392]
MVVMQMRWAVEIPLWEQELESRLRAMQSDLQLSSEGSGSYTGFGVRYRYGNPLLEDEPSGIRDAVKRFHDVLQSRGSPVAKGPKPAQAVASTATSPTRTSPAHKTHAADPASMDSARTKSVPPAGTDLAAAPAKATQPAASVVQVEPTAPAATSATPAPSTLPALPTPSTPLAPSLPPAPSVPPAPSMPPAPSVPPAGPGDPSGYPGSTRTTCSRPPPAIHIPFPPSPPW